MRSRNPFEVVTAKKMPCVQAGSVRPRRPYVRVGDDDYLVEPDPRVAMPELLIEPDPRLDPYELLALPPAPEHPIVKLRQAIRECREAGIPDSRLEEVVALELVDFVMGS